jgi:hypothetical protein
MRMSEDPQQANFVERRVCELRRIRLPRSWVHREAGGYGLRFDSAEPFARAELTSRTPETRRS